MKRWNDEYAQMLEDIQHRESKLTDWERHFFDEMDERLARGKLPTERQLEILDEVWERIT